jgi:hypothetical protein
MSVERKKRRRRRSPCWHHTEHRARLQQFLLLRAAELINRHAEDVDRCGRARNERKQKRRRSARHLANESGPYQRRSPRAFYSALSAGLKNDLILGKKKADAWWRRRCPSLTPATSSLMCRTPKLLIEVLGRLVRSRISKQVCKMNFLSAYDLQDDMYENDLHAFGLQFRFIVV